MSDDLTAIEEEIRRLNAAVDRFLAEREEMLQALKWVLPMAERYLSKAPGDPDNAKLETARAVIAKAEGE